jgi:hypothetical protein
MSEIQSLNNTNPLSGRSVDLDMTSYKKYMFLLFSLLYNKLELYYYLSDYSASSPPSDDDVYLDKLQTRGVKKSIRFR